MSGWKTYKLSELVEIKYGKDHKHLLDGEIPVYGSGGIMRYAETHLYDKESILIPRKGTLSNLFYLDKPFWSVDTMFYTKIKNGVHGKYLYYLLKSMDLASMNVGSAVPSLTTEVLNKVEISLPVLPTQQQIAQILSSLDDKIELNLQMNKTLEAMAQAIFKEWFVNFNFPGFDGELVDGLPKGWSKITLDEIAKVKNGYAFKGTDFINEGVPVIKIKNVKPNKILLNDLSYVSREVADKAIKYVINQDDILITMSGNRMNGTPDTWVGKVALFQRQGEYLLNQRVSVIDLTPDYSHLKYYLTILLSSIEFQNYFISSATSSGGQANISPALIYSTEIILPDLETSQKFYLTIKSFYDKILENELQIESLTQTRDTLLPKLMSGNIAVMNA